MIDIDALTIGEARRLVAVLTPISGQQAAAPTHPYPVGKNVLVRTVTMTLVGRLREVHAQELVLDDAAWVAETARFSVSLATGVLLEVEPFPGAVIVGRGSIVDCCEWTHDLPRVAQ